MGKGAFAGVLCAACVVASMLLTALAPAARAEASGWGTAQPVEPAALRGATAPRVAVDAGGNATAVWAKETGQVHSVAASRYAVGAGWGPVELVETNDTADIQAAAEVAMDPAGNAIAVWTQAEHFPWDVWANRYSVGAGWGTPVLLETNDTEDSEDPVVAMDPAGNAIAMWYSWNGTRAIVWASRYSVGAGWGTPELLDGWDSNVSPTPDLAVDAAGNVTAVWLRQESPRDTIRSSRFVPGAGWTPAELVSGAARYPWDPHVAVDPAGNAIAVWTDSGAWDNDVWTNRYVIGTGWGTPALLDSESRYRADFPRVAIDAAGNAIAVWQQSNGTLYSTWANRYAAGKGWGVPVAIEANGTADTGIPELAMSPAGDAVVLWQQWHGTNSTVWSNRYVAPTGDGGQGGSPFPLALAVAIIILVPILVFVFLALMFRPKKRKKEAGPKP